MKLRFLFPVLLLVAAFGCKDPYKSNNVRAQGEAITFPALLSDTLPSKTFRQLQMPDVKGTVYNDLNGNKVFYFKYQADPDVIIDVLSKSAFDINGQISDTVCRKISYDELAVNLNTDGDNTFEAHSFLDKYEQRFEIFECLKSPLRHQLLIDRMKGTVFHRIVKAG
jgi:hypothetical protein